MHPFAKQTSEPDTERYTPPEVVAAVKDTLGQIDLDPATTALVNGTFIRAKRYYTKETDGLNRENPWTGRVFINPPGGIKGQPNPKAFWERLIVEYQAKQVTSAIFLAFDIEHLQQSQGWNHMMVQWPFCIPEKRLIFYREKNGHIEPRDYPEFSSAILYVGKSIKRFTESFKNIGAIIIPRVITNRPTNYSME
jgi:hypothetical protein